MRFLMGQALRESSDEVLRARLEQALTEATGAPTNVVELSRKPFPYETSFAIDELLVRVGTGAELRLLVKDVGHCGLSAVAAATKPSFLIEPGREIAVYRELLAPASLSSPRLHGVSVDEQRGRWWLFLEHVDGEVLTDVGEIGVWEETAAWAAQLSPAVSGAIPSALDGLLVHRDALWHARWIDAALTAVEKSAGSGASRLAKRLPLARDRLLNRLDGMPRAFVHGELYPANVVIARHPNRPARIAPVDWELAGTGPYPLDLAALTSGWGEQERRVMCRAYHDSLSPARRSELGFEDLIEAVNVCRLALALQWIGWAPGWSPPEGQRSDWIVEANELLDEVGL